MEKTQENPEFLQICCQAAQAGGDELMRWLGRFQVRAKAPADLVTEADLAAQSLIRDIVLTRFPDHGFLGEEHDAGHGGGETAEYVWIVDPLDGTTNFVHGFPHFCVSVALVCLGKPIAAAVFDPNRNELFSAARGGGAFCNGEPACTSGTETLAESLLAVSFPPLVRRDSEEVELFLRMLDRGRALRRTGSAALNLAYVASGRLDAFWATTLHAWDVAAGILLVEEAGGVVKHLDGSDFRLRDPRLMATATPELFESIRPIINDGFHA